MSAIPGHQAVLAIKKAATWHTPVEAGAGDGLLANSESVGYTVEQIEVATVGTPQGMPSKLGRESVTGQINANLRYDGLVPLLAAGFFGVDTITTPANAVLTRKHALYDVSGATVPVNNDGVFFTLAKQLDSAKVMEIPSWKIGGLTIAGNSGEIASVVADGIGDTANQNTNGASEVNKTSTISNVSYTQADEETDVCVDPSTATLKLSTAAADSLADAAITGFEISPNRGHVAEAPFDSAATGKQVSEPKAGGNRAMLATCRIDFDLSDATTLALWDALKVGTQYIGVLRIQGDLIETVTVTAGSFTVGSIYTIVSAGTTDFTLIGAADSNVGTVFTATGVGTGSGTASENFYQEINFEMRYMKVTEEAQEISGAGKLSPSVNFELHSDSSAAYAGFSTAADGPVLMWMHNERTTQYLA